MTIAVMTCVHAGRRVKKKQQRQESTRQDAQAAHGGKKREKLQCTGVGHTVQSKQAAGEGVGAIGSRDKKRNRRQVTQGSKRQGGEDTKDAGGPMGYRHG